MAEPQAMASRMTISKPKSGQDFPCEGRKDVERFRFDRNRPMLNAV